MMEVGKLVLKTVWILVLLYQGVQLQVSFCSWLRKLQVSVSNLMYREYEWLVFRSSTCSMRSCAGRVRWVGGGCRLNLLRGGCGLCSELNQLKNRKARGCTVLELFGIIALRTASLQQLLQYDVATTSVRRWEATVPWPPPSDPKNKKL